MPAALTYPGVYVEEISSGVRTITGVATSVTAFIGRAFRGPCDEPVTINNYGDFERQFGGLWRDSTMSYAVQQFFRNGGGTAVIVRVVNSASATTPAPATIQLNGGGGMKLQAANPGSWGNNLTAEVKHNVKDTSDNKLFNLIIEDDPDKKNDAIKRGGSGIREIFLNISCDENSPRYVKKVLAQQSQLVRCDQIGDSKPSEQKTPATSDSGRDGVKLLDADIVGNESKQTGIYSLTKTDLFNLLCIPPLTLGDSSEDIATDTWNTATKFCYDRRALLIIDAPKTWDVANAPTKVGDFNAYRQNAAIYFPRVKISDPNQEGKLEDFAPCGVIAGIMSRTDSTRGVWKAPAGTEANLSGVLGFSINGLPYNLTNDENGRLNQEGVNCLRNLPGAGRVAWGARTLAGKDTLTSEWKYIPVRRTALLIEESLYRGTQWVVFEPNDEPLWAQIRLNVGSFMHNLFRQGAFQGSTPKEAYFVKCDKETNPQNDIDRGIVNIMVGFAPLKPAEFVLIKLQQIAGNLEV